MLASMTNITKYFGDKLILKNIDVSIENHDRIGLVGANGIGKSTLLNILCKKIAPDEGTINITNNVTIGMLKQNSGLSRGNTIYTEMQKVFSDLIKTEKKLRELEQKIATAKSRDKTYNNLIEEYSKLSSWFELRGGYQIDVKIKTILNGMGFEDKSYDMLIDSLSGGEKTRLAIAKLLLEEPDLLILDEPTNHLDFITLSWLEDHLQSYKGGLLVVSHDRYFLDKIVSRIWEIENKKVISFSGNYTKYKQLRSERIKRLKKEYETQQIKINAMKEFAQRNIARATTSNMAKSRLHQLEHIEIMEKPVDIIPTPKFHFEFDKRPVKDLLTVKNLTLCVGEKTDSLILSKDINFDIKRDEKIALIGPNGIGKSSFLKTILGFLPAHGEIRWGDRVKIGYYEQENLTLNKNNTALEEIWGRFPMLAQYEARGILGQVLITGDNVFKKIGVLSGGERARVALAVLMAQHSNTLVLDEPTNHLDLQSKEELEKALSDFKGTLLFVSHDRYFLNTIPTKIIELNKDGVSIYNGNFDCYLTEKKKEEQLAPPAKPSRKKAAERSNYRSKRERAEQAKRKSKIQKLESAIEDSESHIKQLQSEIESPKTACNYEKLSSLCAELEEIKLIHDNYFAEWAKLSEIE